MSDVSTALGVRLYPDLVEQGGLASALAATAARHGLDVGRLSAGDSGRSRYTQAAMACDRGSVHVRLGSDARYFMINLSEGGRVEAHGDACDLLPVVQVVDVWRGGVPLADLAARFPFLTVRPARVQAS
ncbi:hypothetical protein [Micromonospora sp. RTGN7]|uniref:hypothetical protein n=1 Tax=Micromonospora sp. RTGN7 TaxID=3016526 RepID=UPI0029FEC7E0|nr:hypothetical protein [Micromonospora sp. RTGN7]